MCAIVRAPVNPSMLEWARDDAGYTVEAAAALIKQTPEILRRWEEGESLPTLRQAEALAKVYDRAFSVFSLPRPPDFPPLQTEYRRLPNVQPGGESPELRRSVRRLVQRRRIGLHLFAELAGDPPPFILRAKLGENVEEVGTRTRNALGISLDAQFEWPSEYAAYRGWREAVERQGVLVSQFSGKGLPQIRGTSILHFPLPVIGISSKEIPLSKPFTLLHELIHLSLAASEEEKSAAEEKRSDAEWLSIERFCEAAASAVLMPKDAIESDRDVLSETLSGMWGIEAMRRIARRYKVTPTAAATRLLWLDIMTPAAYAGWKGDWEAYREAHPDRPGFGIATPAEKAVGRSGPLFVSLVLSALSNDRITPVDASHFLDLGYAHVETLRHGWLRQPLGFAND